MMMDSVCMLRKMLTIEHSENKIIVYFENEVRPRVLQSSFRQK